VWAKRGFGLGGKDFRPQHEMILYGRSGGQCHAGDDVGDVWEFPVPFRGRMLHVAETPVALIAKAIGYVTNNIDLVFDPFLGSGTTLIAAEQLGRKCYGMEISPAYCDVIVKRWQDFTGKKARHADTKMTFEEHRDGQAVLRTD
jgi:DNA modification methylase